MQLQDTILGLRGSAGSLSRTQLQQERLHCMWASVKGIAVLSVTVGAMGMMGRSRTADLQERTNVAKLPF